MTNIEFDNSQHPRNPGSGKFITDVPSSPEIELAASGPTELPSLESLREAQETARKALSAVYERSLTAIVGTCNVLVPEAVRVVFDHEDDFGNYALNLSHLLDADGDEIDLDFRRGQTVEAAVQKLADALTDRDYNDREMLRDDKDSVAIDLQPVVADAPRDILSIENDLAAIAQENEALNLQQKKLAARLFDVAREGLALSVRHTYPTGQRVHFQDSMGGLIPVALTGKDGEVLWDMGLAETRADIHAGLKFARSLEPYTERMDPDNKQMQKSADPTVDLELDLG